MDTIDSPMRPIAPALTSPLYSQRDVAAIINAPESTVQTWARGYSWHPRPQLPVLTDVRPGRGLTVSFLAMTEAFVINAFRKAGLPMSRIRPVVEAINREVGLEYALATQDFVTDGVEVLRLSKDPLDRRMVVVRNGQAVFNDVVADYLKHIDFGPESFAQVVRLPQFVGATVSVRPGMNGGRPTVEQGGVAVEAVLGRLRAGERADDVAEDYGLTLDTVLNLNRQAA